MWNVHSKANIEEWKFLYKKDEVFVWIGLLKHFEYPWKIKRKNQKRLTYQILAREIRFNLNACNPDSRSM